MNDLPAYEIPADLHAEQAVLGSILIDSEKLDLVREKLQGNEFHSKQHEIIFRRMLTLSDSGDPIDIVTLTSELNNHQELEQIGGTSYLTKLASSVPSTANVDHYAEQVKQKHVLRVCIRDANSISQLAATGDIKGIVELSQQAANRLADLSASTKGVTPIKDILLEVYENIERRSLLKDTHQGITGIPSGFRDLDRMTAGFQNSDLIIVAARPSVGKTALALNIAQHAVGQAEQSVLIFSLEMSKQQLVQRMMCAEANIDANKMRTGYIEAEDWEKMSHAVAALSETKLHIDDTPGLNVFEIRSKARTLQKEKGLGLVIIDYLQLISGRGRGRAENRQQEVSEISRMLKQLARELDVPVIALSQLSRSVEQRQDKRPMLSDLRESGSIEQDADIVAFLYRDDYYDKESEKKNIVEVIIAKQRNGQIGTVELVFLKQFNKFVNFDRSHQEQKQAFSKPVPNPYYTKRREEEEDEV